MSPAPLSGPWQGWWRQGLQEGHEVLTLRFLGRHIEGDGEDEDGAFRIQGAWTGEGALAWTKTYTRLRSARPAVVRGEGRWNGRHIRGAWSGAGQGPLLLWPSS